MFEIAGDRMYFETISRSGAVVDADVLQKQQPVAAPDRSVAK
jgi:hypothetical protein